MIQTGEQFVGEGDKFLDETLQHKVLSVRSLQISILSFLISSKMLDVLSYFVSRGCTESSDADFDPFHVCQA